MTSSLKLTLTHAHFVKEPGDLLRYIFRS